MSGFLDFATLQRPASPNHWLVAPASFTSADAVAPAFPLSPAALAENWRRIVEGQPRTRILALSEDGTRVEAEQRSSWFGFVDLISFHAVPSPDDSATFFVYSRSLVGYWDMGVNRRRLENWIGLLRPDQQ